MTTADYTTDYYNEGYVPMDLEDSDFCRLELDPVGTLVQTCVHSLVCVLGLLGNTLVLVTYACYTKCRTMTDLFLLNVAVADLLFATALPLTIYNEQLGWPMASAACKVARGLYSVNLYAGTLLLACVGADRYMAVVQARRFFAARARTPMLSRLVCGAVWASAAALSLPTLIYVDRREELELGSGRVSVSCGMKFSSHNTAHVVKVTVPALQVAVGFLLPLAIMAFCYGSVLHCLLQAQVGVQRRKAVHVVLAVVAVFVVCHLPYNAALLSHTMMLFQESTCTGELRKLEALAASRSLAYLHCCVNPVLYAFVGVKFRCHFRKILQDMWCLGKRFVQPGRSPPHATTSVSVLSHRFTGTSNNGTSFSA